MATAHPTDESAHCHTDGLDTRTDTDELVVTWTCQDRPGIVHAVTGACVQAGGNLTELQQFASADTGNFFMRLQVEGVESATVIEQALREVATRFDAQLRVDRLGRPMRTLILATRAPHCLSHLLFNRDTGRLPIDVVKVMANHPDLEPIAQFHQIPFAWQQVTRQTRDAFETAVLDVVDEYDVELVVLARYMQILSPRMCEALSGRCINIHHSFLPGFKGANPYLQAHERGVKLIGATAHFVTGDLDEGPIIEQRVERVDHAQTVRQLTAVGQDTESTTLAEAVRLFCEHRTFLDGRRTVVFR